MGEVGDEWVCCEAASNMMAILVTEGGVLEGDGIEADDPQEILGGIK